MARNYSNTAVATTLTSGVDSSTTSIPVDSVSGYPSAPFTAILEPGLATEEVVEVTAVVGSTLTATRGVDGTPAQAHGLGSALVHGVSARDFSEPNAHPGDTTNVHGISNTASLVTLTGSQTLSNKTLTAPVINGGTFSSITLSSPTIANFTNAQHTHEDAASGGELESGGDDGGSAWYGGGVTKEAMQQFGDEDFDVVTGLSLTFTAPSSWPAGATKLAYNFSCNLAPLIGVGDSTLRFRDGSTTVNSPGELKIGIYDNTGFYTVSSLGSLPSAGSHTITVQIAAGEDVVEADHFSLWVNLV